MLNKNIETLGMKKAAELADTNEYTLRRALRGIITLTPLQRRKINEAVIVDAPAKRRYTADYTVYHGCVVCGSKLKGRQRKHCSKKCKYDYQYNVMANRKLG